MLNLLFLIFILTAWLVFRLRKLEAKVNTLIQGINRIQSALNAMGSGEVPEKLPQSKIPAEESDEQAPTEENSPRPRLFDFSLKYENNDQRK